MPPAPALAAASSLSVCLILIGIALLRERDELRVRLSQYRLRTVSAGTIDVEEPFSERILRPLFRALVQAVVSLLPHSYVERTRHKLLLAGNPRGWEVRDFIGFQALLALVMLLVGVLIAGGLNIRALVFGGLGAGIGYLLPTVWLGNQIRSRQSEILRALPDALDLLSICVEAGLGFDGALARVAEKWDNALSQEFARVLSEIRVGKSRRDALRDVVPRTEVPELATFIAAVVQADQLGVPIGHVLSVQAAHMRMRRRQRAEELAHQAPIKMIFPMVLFIFPAIYVVTLGPAIPTILEGLGNM